MPMLRQYFDSAKRLAEECINNHPECAELYQNMFGGIEIDLFQDVRKKYTGNNPIVTTAIGCSLPSPDGLEWNEFHHIYGRAHSPVGRLVSRELHRSAHHSGTLVPEPEIIFHCLQPALNYARLYLEGRSAVIPDRPIEQTWMLRVAHEYHTNNGNEIDAATRHLDTHLVSTLHSYIWNVRIESWSTDGTVQKNNIGPSLFPSIYEEWSKEIKHQLTNWYNLTSRQRQYVNHLSSLAGYLATDLVRNGISLDQLQNLSSTYRMAESIYRVAYDIHYSNRDKEELVDRFIEILEETSDQSDINRSKQIIDSWFSVQAIEQESEEARPSIQYRRKGYFNASTIYLLTMMENNEENFRKASEIYDLSILESNVLEVEEW